MHLKKLKSYIPGPISSKPTIPNPNLSNLSLRSFCKPASAFEHDALKVFDEIPQPDTTSWNLIITSHNRACRYTDSWKAFCWMHSLGFHPNEYTYGNALSACVALTCVNSGKLLYSLALKHGFSSDGYVRSGMIDLFLKTRGFDDALRVFNDDASCGNVVCWNAIISGAVKHNEDYVALNLFRQMCSNRGFPSPNKFTFPSVFGACAKLQELELGKVVHGLAVKYGEQEDIVVATSIVDFYAKCGQLDEAVHTFSQMPVRNVVSWTAIIAGFVQQGEFQPALELFKEMVILNHEINKYTVTSVLSACANPKESFQIHCWICKTGFYSDPTVKNSLINLYAKIGAIALSEQVFNDLRDLMTPSTYATMITALCKDGSLEKAFSLFKEIFLQGLTPDISCIPSLMSVINHLELAEQMHCYSVKTGVNLNRLAGCSLFTMYSKCGSLNESYEIFKQIPDKDNVSWASMISGFTEHGFPYKAIELFREMLLVKIDILDEATLTAVLAACSSLRLLKTGKEIQGFFIRQGKKPVFGGSSVVNMYSRCGDLKSGKKVFDFLPFKDAISCSSLISGYAQNGYIKEGLHLFLNLISSGLEVDSFTISAVLGAITDLNDSDSVMGARIGVQLHSHILKLGFESQASVGSSLVMMYSKYGKIEDCLKGFKEIKNPDLISWTAMIHSYAQHGKGSDALKAFELMKKFGTRPDSVTFVGVLTACSHSGLVKEGYSYLKSMVRDYGIEPGQEHYACMVDVLGRSGRLKEAERFVRSMPIEPGSLVWGSLLAACKLHGDVEIGKIAAEKVIELEPSSDGGYVAFSNIYADVGQWEQAMNIRNEMKGIGIIKQPGWSYS